MFTRPRTAFTGMVGRFAAICVATACVAVALASSHTSPTNISVLANTPDRVIIQYQFPDFESTTVDLKGEPHFLIKLPGEPCMLVAGAPELPHVARSIVIPDDGSMEIRVTDASFDDLTDVAVAPSKGSLPRTIDPATVPYTFGAIYAKDAFFPGELATLHDPYILRDHRGVAVDVFPLQYNPVSRTLRVYRSLTVEVSWTATSSANALQRDAVSRDSVVFEDIYTSHFINYLPRPRYAPIDETGNMLIICYDTWLPNIQPLVTHKNSIGMTTTAVGVSTIPGGNTSTAIKNYIQNVYNQGNLAFVLLVGDSAQIATPSSAGGSADPVYSKVAGTDNYPDIIVGRFSAEIAAHVDTQVLRTIEYENMPATQQTWFWKGTGIASNQGPGDDGEYDNVHIGNIRANDLLPHGYTLVDQIYDPSATAAMVTTALNGGRGIINYCGHGSQNSWSSSGFSSTNVAALANDNMLPFIVSVACVNGQFAGGSCFAEAWLRSTRAGEPIGAIGAYMSSINQDWNPPMQAQDEFNALYSVGTYVSYGGLCFAGSCSMMDAYGSTTGSAGVNMFDTWHIFGDPSLRVVGVVTPPHGIEVTPNVNFFSQGPVGGPFAPASMDYTIKNLGNTPLNYEVTKSESWLSLTNATGTLPGKGSVIVTVSISAAADSMGTGLFNDTLYFTNTTDHDGDTSQPASLKIGVPTMQYSWSLDNNPGWTATGQWAFGAPAGAGGQYHGYPDPAGGMTGTNVYGVNLAGDYLTTAGGPYYLTLGPVNLQATSDITLRFQRWLNSDYQPYVYATLEASNNGATWTQIWSNGSTVLTQNTWALQTHNISAVATDQPAVYLRWGYKVGNGAYAYSGWNIDDIQIWGLKASGPQHPIGDLNCDGTVGFSDINPFVLSLTDAAGYAAAFPDCDINLADINGDEAVNFADINPFVTLLTTP